MNEIPIQFCCSNETLMGILSYPENGNEIQTGIVISVGGPQYRVGSHRQFVTLARALAHSGYTVFRFDYRGMGDSSGSPISFEEAGPDIKAAVDTILTFRPDLGKIILLGLCDAASINLMYAVNDPRITGLILLNPWCRTESGKAESELRHYYIKRLLEKEFWQKLFQNKVNLGRSVYEIMAKVWKVAWNKTCCLFWDKSDGDKSLPERMENAFLKFSGPMLLIVSGNDLVAGEFMDRVAASGKWLEKIESEMVCLEKMDEADHTFSTRQWKDQVVFHIQSWLYS